MSKRLLLLAFVAGFINAVPLLLFDGSSDLVFRYSLIHCFSSEFWQGDFYPRWCSDAYGGLGAPLFLFYFPLSYYITSIFYPLHWLGLSIPGIYFLSVFLCNSISFLTAFLWLRDVAGHKSALFAAFLYLWMPYRMEVIVFRSAFTELWCMAFVPLLFFYARRLVQAPRQYWLPLAFAATCCVLSQLFTAGVALMGCGLYVVLMTGKQVAAKAWLFCAFVVTALATAFYALPAKFFLPYSNPDAWKKMETVWMTTYFDFAANFSHGRFNVNINLLFTLAACVGLGLWMALKKQEARKEIITWCIIAAVAAVMLFPASVPLWDAFPWIRLFSSPYRMQVLLMLAVVFFLSLAMPALTNIRNNKEPLDYWVLIGALMLFSAAMGNQWTPPQREIFTRMINAHYIPFYEYVSKWTDLSTVEAEKVIARAENHNQPQAQWLKGKGGFSVRVWDSRNMVITTHAAAAGRLRVEQFYFPIWQAQIDGASQLLLPEDKTGKMLIDIPAGDHEVTIHRDTLEPMPLPYRLVVWISCITLLLLAYSMMHRWRLVERTR